MNPDQIQQGDVTIELIEKLPDGCVPRSRDSSGRAVVREGSASGNQHYFDAPGVTLHDGPDGKMYVVNDGDNDAPMKHTRDHDPVFVPAHRVGVIGDISEIDHLTGLVSQVVD